jgi:hypothetical protein
MDDLASLRGLIAAELLLENALRKKGANFVPTVDELSELSTRIRSFTTDRSHGDDGELATAVLRLATRLVVFSAEFGVDRGVRLLVEHAALRALGSAPENYPKRLQKIEELDRGARNFEGQLTRTITELREAIGVLYRWCNRARLRSDGGFSGRRVPVVATLASRLSYSTAVALERDPPLRRRRRSATRNLAE